jgi:subfamily B ATP-binding cassette protein HlyB/CyaB
MAMFIVFSSAMTWVRQYLVLHTGNRVDAVLGQRIFGHLLRLFFPYFQARPTGVIVARLLGVETIRSFISGAAVTLVLDCPFLLIFLGIMLYYSWMLTLIAVGILFVIGVISFLVAPFIRARLNEQFLLGARNQAFLTEYVAGMETVKALQMEPRLVDRYGSYLADYLRAAFRTRQLSNTYNVVANGLEQVLTLSILVAGATLVMKNEGFTIGMLVAFQMFANRLSQPVLRLVGLWQEFLQAAIAVARLGDIMNAPADPVSYTPTKIGSIPGTVEFENVSFRYLEDRAYVLKDLSFRVAPGECMPLTGPSGSGKSTIAKLLLGLYSPTSGAIKIDGEVRLTP